MCELVVCVAQPSTRQDLKHAHLVLCVQGCSGVNTALGVALCRLQAQHSLIKLMGNVVRWRDDSLAWKSSFGSTTQRYGQKLLVQ